MKSGIYAAAAITSALFTLSPVGAQTVSLNSGSLGAAGNGTNTSNVVLTLAGPIVGDAATDRAAGYGAGERTTVPFNAALNPQPSTAPFTIEFWAQPNVDPGDAAGPSPLFNRVSSGNRSGWVFFQRSATTGWNFRMYNGNAGTVGFDLTGGTYTVGAWTHVVAVWTGTAAVMYVNGALADDTNSGAGGYASSTAATLSIGAYDDGNNPFNGGVDETAFYSKALTGSQILAHFNAASSPTPGTYQNLVLGDGAVEYLRNAIPEPSTVGLLGLGAIALVGKRRRTLR
jgi:hypothetical protein